MLTRYALYLKVANSQDTKRCLAAHAIVFVYSSGGVAETSRYDDANAHICTQ